MITKEQQEYMIAICPSCNTELTFDGIHLCCTNPNCESRMLSKLSGGLRIFGIENIGGATVEKIFNAGIKTILDVFNPNKFNKVNLVNSGQFKEGRSLDIVLESVKKHLPFTYARIIDSLMFDNTGSTISIQIAKIFEGTIPNWDNMSKAAYEPFLNPASVEYQKVIQFVKLIYMIGCNIETEKKVDTSNCITYELTGKPALKNSIKTKNDLISIIAKMSWINTDLKVDTNYLITDDLGSTSSKMKKAEKLGIKIITYEDLYDLLKL